MAKNGALPGAFQTPVLDRREGRLTRGVIVSGLAVALDLGQIAVLGAAP